MTLPDPGTLWRRRRTGRVARVLRVLGAPWHLVEYRYVAPPPVTRGNGWIVGRTNTTAMGAERFEAQWERASNLP